MTEATSTTEKSRKINSISKQTVHRICSGQVILDLGTALKELVENSLDSGATIIDVKLNDYGKVGITVSDNGSGVVEDDFEGLGLKHHTSKLREFSDLTEVNTFGFRGEALSSLCSLSELSIITRHSTSEHGFKLNFDHNGVLQKKEVCPREKGTTIHIKNIFKCLPVRAKEFQRNLKKEYAHAIQILYSYCLISVGTKITCSNIVSGKSSNTLISTTSSSDILNNINTIFGKKSSNGLVKVELLPPDEAILQEYNLPNDAVVDFEWDCYISSCKNNIGRSTPDRQFIYVNSRPCDLTKVSKLINKTYHNYNNKQYPFIFLNLKLNRQLTDINVTPDKRTIFCMQERLILATIKFSLKTKWDSLQPKLAGESMTEFKFGVKRAISPQLDYPAKRLQNTYLLPSTQQTKEKIIQHENIDTDNDDSNVVEQINVLNCVVMPISIFAIKQKLVEKQMLPKYVDTCTKIKYKVQMESNQNLDAENELKRQLTNESFLEMEILGQFNLGFIIARLKEDLFIIDQHATDEKYRFEKLNKETELKSQKLVIPKSLNLSSINETILIENQNIFEGNGFSFKINPEAESRHRVELSSIPVSGNWQFGQDDIEELIFLIKESGGENKKSYMFRPSRVRQMLASRACRSAVMIGTALNNNEMQKIVKQMSQMENPWSCPHGRPTIRHLVSLQLLHTTKS